MEQLLCGAAKEKITPPAEAFPISAGKGRIISDVMDDLYVRVISLKTGRTQLLLISFDLAGVPEATKWVTEISESYHVPVENILFFATHAHATPVIGFQGASLSPSECMIAAVWRTAMMRAISTAVEAMQPTQYGYAEVNSYMNVNRNAIYRERSLENQVTREYCAVGNRFEGPSDKTLAVVRFENLQGTPIAFFINYPVHLVAMHRNRCGKNGMAISSDIGGLACQYMEERFGGAVAMWSSGAAGDQNPLMMNRMYYPSPKNNEMLGTESDDYAICLAQAARHFDDILRANDKIAANCREAEVKTGVGYSKTPARMVDLNGDKDPLGRNIDQYVYAADEENTYDVRIQVIELGALALVGVSGELYSSIGSLMKQVSPMKHTIVVTHAHGNDGVYSGYIYDDEGCAIGGNGGLYRQNSRMLPGYVPSDLCRVMMNLMKK